MNFQLSLLQESAAALERKAVKIENVLPQIIFLTFEFLVLPLHYRLLLFPLLHVVPGDASGPHRGQMVEEAWAEQPACS